MIVLIVTQLLRAATVPESVPLGKFVRVKLDAGEKAIVLSQDFSPVDIIATPDSLAFTGLPGRYVVVVLKGDEQPQQFFTKIVGLKPEPKPDPKPDDPPKPPPDVNPAPVKAPGLRVLIVYESSQLSIMPSTQREILFNTNLRAWMTQNCARDNNRPEWRIVDQNQPDIVDTAPLKAMFERPRMSLPWLVISNGTKNTGYEGVLPANADEMQRLLEAHK
ncbi:MAG: hypothetical protein E6Q97_33200 [Desulfurellales bacterium]|nr:MAG: hypothetical protein E6Q97_33200 [Desulfurellales bacterium]